MKRSEFNKVFRRLRWDDSRRRELEVMLSRPAVQPQKRKKAVTEEVILMSVEKRNNSKRSGWRTAAAAVGVCAAAGVIVGGIALLGRDDDPLLPQTSLSGQTSQSGNEASGTDPGKSPFTFVEDNVEGDLKTKFEGPDDVPSLTVTRSTNTNRKYAASKLLEGPSGWYCTPFAQHYNSFDEGNLIVYTDAASGADTPLCARPECTHDNEYCTANNSKYAGVPAVYYDGYLYGICADTDKIEVKEPEGGETWFSSDRGDIVLVRYAPDGTEITKLCSFIDAAPDSLQHARFEDVEIIGHRGALWIAAKFEQTYGVFNDSWGDGFTEISENRQGYGLFHYDLDSGKLTPVIYYGLNEEFTEATTPYRLSGYGDYVYFMKNNSDWADPYNGNYIYRVNIRTGAVEKVTDQAIAGYGMGGGKIIYLRNYNDATDGDYLQPWVIDLATGEQRMFLGEEDYMVGVQCTDDYVILTADSKWYEACIYDWEGNLLSTIQQPKKVQQESFGDDYLMKSKIAYFAVSGDRLYGWCIDYGTLSDLYYTPLYTAAAEGKTDWQYALEIMGDGIREEGEEPTDLWSKYHQWSGK